MGMSRAERALSKTMDLYDESGGRDADEITDEELAIKRQINNTPVAKVSAGIRRVTNRSSNRSKYQTARGSSFEMWNNETESLHEVKAHIRDTKLLAKSAKWSELAEKGTTHLIIEDDDNNMKALPNDITMVQSLRSLTIMWTKIKTPPVLLGKMLKMTHLSIQKCPLKSADGIHMSKNLTGLELINDGLTILPSQLGDMSTLVNLNLSGNNIKLLPTNIGNLRNLKTLVVSGNKLSEIPLSLTGLKSLETLDASHNQIRELPQLVGNLGELVTLRLTHNYIANLPASFKQLLKLKYLYLSNNDFETIPASLGQLPELQTLNCVSNAITTMEASLPNITTLLLDKNYLHGVPDELFGCVQLEQLSIKNNHIPSIPPDINKLTRLRSLSLNSNDLDELPNELCELENLRHLVLRENDISELPSKFDSLEKLSMVDIEGTKLDFQLTYALKHNGINGLREYVKMRREQQLALKPDDANSDRGSSVFDEEDDTATDFSENSDDDTDDDKLKPTTGVTTADVEPQARDSGYTENHVVSRRDVNSEDGKHVSTTSPRKEVVSIWPSTMAPPDTRNSGATAVKALQPKTSQQQVSSEVIEMKSTEGAMLTETFRSLPADAQSGTSGSTYKVPQEDIQVHTHSNHVQASSVSKDEASADIPVGEPTSPTKKSPPKPPKKPSVKTRPSVPDKPTGLRSSTSRDSISSQSSFSSQQSNTSEGGLSQRSSDRERPAVKPKPQVKPPSIS